MPRHVSDCLAVALNGSQFWQAIVSDPDLQPEIRNDAVTVYFKAQALIRDLRLGPSGLVGQTHFRFVPLRCMENAPYLVQAMSDSGMTIAGDASPLSLANGEPEVLAQYKRMINAACSPESKVVGRIMSRNLGAIIDQEYEFAESGLPERDRIDVCFCEPQLDCIAFAEVKVIHDRRLRTTNGGIPEVIRQLRRYQKRISDNSTDLASEFAQVLADKRRIGLQDRVTVVSESACRRMLAKAVLIIGVCSRDDVAALLEPATEWQPLMSALPEVAAGLILCEHKGCRLSVKNGRQVRVFDSSVLHTGT